MSQYIFLIEDIYVVQKIYIDWYVWLNIVVMHEFTDNS